MLRLSVVGRALVLILGVFSLASPASAANPAGEPDEERLAHLVKMLGSDAFETREEASKQLGALGRKAIKALQEGLKSDDMEVYRRCTELIEKANRSDLEVALDSFLENQDEKQLLKLSAWPKFQKAVGDSANARNLFVQMCTADGALLDLAERNISSASTLYNQRCQELQQRMNQPFAFQQLNLISNGELAALLYVGMDSRIRVDQNLRYMVNNLLHQQGPQRWIKSDATGRKLLASYIQARTDINLVHNHLYLVQNLEVREALNWVAGIADGKSQQPYVRATALATLGRLGGREYLPKLEGFFNDATQLTTFQQAQNVQIRTEVRDVALAMAVLASGQDLVPYNFPWMVQMAPHLAQNPMMPYHSAFQLGFANNEQRDAAFKRYKEWQGKQAPTKPEAPKK